MGIIVEKFRVLRDKNFTAANFTEKLMDYYGDRITSILESPLRYKVLASDTIYATDAMKFINRVGNFLKDAGVKREDIVAVCMENNADMFMIMLAIFKIGAIALPINSMLRLGEIDYILKDSGARFFIFDRYVFDENIKELKNVSYIENLIMAGPADTVLDGVESLDIGIEGEPIELSPVDMKPGDPVGIFYTSGTTGKPKGAITTSRSLIQGQKMAGIVIPTRKSDLGIFSLPFAHIMGTAVAILGTFANVKGYLIKHFEAKKVLKVITKNRITVFVGVPAMYGMMIDELRRNNGEYDLSSVRIWASAADAMPPEYVEEMRKYGALVRLGPLRIKPLFLEAYGMVELSGIATLKVPLPVLRCKPGCIGWPVPPMKIRIIDENGEKLPSGKTGEVVVKGPGVTKGYWKNPEKTKESFTPDGWFRTGDIGKKDFWGRVYFMDRKKDLIKSGGYSIFPAEVEAEMRQHPDIFEIAVFGVPHPIKKEIPVAVVTLHEDGNVTEEELVKWAKEHIAPYKAPRKVKIIERGTMPYGPTEKILKRFLKERYGKEFIIS